MTDLSTPILLAAAATFFAAGIVKGVTGMGLPTVAMGVLGALISPLAAVSLLIVPSFVTNVWQLLAGPTFGTLVRRPCWYVASSASIGRLAARRLSHVSRCRFRPIVCAKRQSVCGLLIAPATARSRKHLNDAHDSPDRFMDQENRENAKAAVPRLHQEQALDWRDRRNHRILDWV
ncbi:sulfite exporter TauE/SafE family protein [Sinorhizobium numidicum]|uniref:Probable membrane transporter protein n=1 Tax=Sinorhizobium numidicum TaxID=680248 RepID=A0ABY8CV48_9HYPH|nr:sulfite exporter TauE/SafE family protein [Sinorhizobium numidicum]WEX75134.1 sulfite exporter TauE/SafE family protein [Sinorhizobium numidicum]WEX81128.1 sulfite exporter TauE/SafE family protein [Sinorhizobium numidicum]